MKKRVFSLGILALATTAFMSCSDNDDNNGSATDGNAALYSEVLEDLSTDVITKTYEELNTNAIALRTAINALTIGDEAKLTAVKNAWKDTRAPWEKSEGFLYGPVDTEGIDPAMDTWPVDVNAMEAILNSGNAITPEVIADNDGSRGFHLIEYLVWGINGQKTAASLTARELEYLKAAALDLQGNTQKLYNGWKATEGNFTANFITAGTSTSIYTSQKDALEEIVDGLITIADEVAAGKIQTPLDEGVATEESRFSNNSKTDFANNMRSIQNIYLGDYNGDTESGLTDIVVLKNAALDTEIKNKISAAIAAIEGISGTFTEAVTENTAAVENARDKVIELKTLLQSQLKPFILNN